MSNQTIKALRKAVAAERGPEDGSVVTFTRAIVRQGDFERDLPPEARKLSYAALFVAGKWYFTGSTSRSPMSARRFAEFLSTPEVQDVRVVTATKPLEKAPKSKVYAIDSDGDKWEPVPNTDLWHCVTESILDRNTDDLKRVYGPITFHGLD